ncbi:DUF3566 domain-containing protein [Streptomyces sp. NPDC021212]|uniref:DUF3566 domain-containing protein n=1 Tax=Streptomyces sp. NPDC021212 TaxID=3365118 RepID=UPI0037BAF402
MSGATGGAGGSTGAEGRPGATPPSAGGASAANDARGPAADSQDGADSQGGTATDTRKLRPVPASDPQPERQASSPLPSERAAQPQPERPYHPPQAYAPPPGGSAATAGRGISAQPAVPGQQPHGAAGRRPGTGTGTGGGAPAARPAPRTRKARLRVAKLDPWSVMKVSFLLAIALGICTVVAASVLWMVMDAMGVFSAVGGTISEATEGQQGSGFDLQSFLSLPRVMTFTSVIAVINVVLATALATLGAFIYNLSAGFVGGVELTLAEDE